MQTHDEIRSHINAEFSRILRDFESEAVTRSTMDAIHVELTRLTRRVREEYGAPMTIEVDGVDREIVDWKIEPSAVRPRVVNITPVIEVNDVE